MDYVESELPKILFDGEKLDDLMNSCNSLKIIKFEGENLDNLINNFYSLKVTKEVNSCDVVEIKLSYNDVILQDPVNTSNLYIELNDKRYILTKIEDV